MNKTPKEKAKELHKEFFLTMPERLNGDEKQTSSIRCALICVDEILETLRSMPIDIDRALTFHYFGEVKQELTKL